MCAGELREHKEKRKGGFPFSFFCRARERTFFVARAMWNEVENYSISTIEKSRA